MSVKAIRTDNGTEFMGEFATIIKNNGIVHQTTDPYSPQSNGIIERYN
jgi:transposase InsO family protein